jgi:hypothetical protein
MDYGQEIRAIGDLLIHAALMQEIRKEVSAVMKNGFVVTDGCHYPNGNGFDVVVRCGSEDRPEVGRRIRGAIKNVEVEKIADGVLGVRVSRRMKGEVWPI